MFGLSVSSAIGVVVTLFTKPEPFSKQRGLVWGTIADAIRHYKGSSGTTTETESAAARGFAVPYRSEVEPSTRGEAQLAVVTISEKLAEQLKAQANDLVYVSDARSWLGGLRSVHAIVGSIDVKLEGEAIQMAKKGTGYFLKK